MFCGLMLFRFRLRLRDTSLDLVNRYGHIMAAAHLYIAATSYVGSSPFAPRLQPWPIIDKVLELHGKGDICGGKTPATLLELFDCVMAAYGCSKELREAMQHLSLRQPSSARLVKTIETSPETLVAPPRRLEDHATWHI